MHTTPVPFTTVTTTSALGAVWRSMMGPGGFGHTSLWVIFFDPRRRLQRTVMPLDDLPATPEPSMLDAMSRVLVRSLDEQGLGSAAFLLSRPGPRPITSEDRTWARALLSLDDERLRYWPVHLATRGEVRVFAPDDLLGAARGCDRCNRES